MAAHSAERADPSFCVRLALSRRLPALAIGGNVLALGCAVGLAPQAVSLGVALCYAILFLASVLLRLLACAASYEAQECPQSLADAAFRTIRSSSRSIRRRRWRVSFRAPSTD